MFGRPPTIVGPYYNVQPFADENNTPQTHCMLYFPQHRSSDIINRHLVHIWRYAFVVECLGPVHIQAFSTNPPNYTTVLALTRRVEAYPAWDPPGLDGNREQPDYANRMMQRHLSRMYKQVIVLHLHRAFFALGEHISLPHTINVSYGIQRPENTETIL